MLLHILSDLHLEFGNFTPPKTEADVVLLAGDIHVGLRALSWAREAFAGTPVLYVPGNHEFYGQATPVLVHELKEAAEGTNVRVMDTDAVEIDGVTFLGATLWTDYALLGNPAAAMLGAQAYMNDFRQIRFGLSYRGLRPTDTAALHADARSWLMATAANARGRLVVVTHHAPSARSVPESYRTARLAPCLASDLEQCVEQLGPGVWVHGHLHSSSDYRLGTTRVLCNPRGSYPSALNPDFAPGLTIEV